LKFTEIHPQSSKLSRSQTEKQRLTQPHKWRATLQQHCNTGRITQTSIFHWRFSWDGMGWGDSDKCCEHSL